MKKRAQQTAARSGQGEIGKSASGSGTRRSVVEVAHGPDESMEAATARTLLRPSVQAAATIQRMQGDTSDVNALVIELTEQIEVMNAGDMRRAEGMLLAQAHTLNELFNNLIRRAANQEYLRQYETYFRLALKAQSQCRTTLEALAEMKNPRPVAFVRQANIAHGPQQVNNAPQPARAGNSDIPSNEEIGATDAPKALDLDPGTPSTAVDLDSHLAPVGALNRPTDGAR